MSAAVQLGLDLVYLLQLRNNFPDGLTFCMRRTLIHYPRGLSLPLRLNISGLHLF